MNPLSSLPRWWKWPDPVTGAQADMHVVFGSGHRTATIRVRAACVGREARETSLAVVARGVDAVVAALKAQGITIIEARRGGGLETSPGRAFGFVLGEVPDGASPLPLGQVVALPAPHAAAVATATEVASVDAETFCPIVIKRSRPPDSPLTTITITVRRAPRRGLDSLVNAHRTYSLAAGRVVEGIEASGDIVIGCDAGGQQSADGAAVVGCIQTVAATAKIVGLA